MAIVKMHEASDGSLFKKHEDYLAHETELRLRENIKDVRFDTNSFDTDEGGHAVLYKDNIADFIVANRELLRDAIAGSAVPVRGRKPKAA